MRKTIIIAIREYLAAVKTKSFIISLFLLPVMMFAGLIAQKVERKIGDTSTRRVAVIDRTPGEVLYLEIARAVQEHNTKAVFDESGRQVRSTFELEKTEPAEAGNSTACDAQRLTLSDRVRSGELLGFVEIGPNLLQPATATAATQAAGASAAALLKGSPPDPANSALYSTNRPTYRDFTQLLHSVLPDFVRQQRLASAGMSYERLKPYLADPRVDDRGLAERQAGGGITYASQSGQIAPFIVPVVFLMLMFVVVMVGASPMTANVIEEKQLRIAEVLLGSVRPFELMMGKLIGGVGVALTLAAIYFSGAYFVAYKNGVAGYVSGAAIAWFIFFTILGTLMYGSIFVAAGAAVTNIKEAQTMVMPIVVLIMVPLFLLNSMIQDPGGALATAASFFPFSAPMIMTARISIPPGAPAWQAILSALITLGCTVCLVWAGGRIFRVGLLMQGQGAKVGQMLQWVLRG